jgi:hypothetical protein
VGLPNKIRLLAFDRWSINDLKRELDPIGCHVQLVREKVSDIPIGLVSADARRRGPALLFRRLPAHDGVFLLCRGIVLVWVVVYFLTRAAFPLALAVGSSGDRTILPAGLCPVTLLSPILWAS